MPTAERKQAKAKSSPDLIKTAQELGLMSKHPGKYQCPVCGKLLSVGGGRGHRCK